MPHLPLINRRRVNNHDCVIVMSRIKNHFIIDGTQNKCGPRDDGEDGKCAISLEELPTRNGSFFCRHHFQTTTQRVMERASRERAPAFQSGTHDLRNNKNNPNCCSCHNWSQWHTAHTHTHTVRARERTHRCAYRSIHRKMLRQLRFMMTNVEYSWVYCLWRLPHIAYLHMPIDRARPASNAFMSAMGHSRTFAPPSHNPVVAVSPFLMDFDHSAPATSEVD